MLRRMEAATTEMGRCRLEHPIFARLGEISFRRADSDGAPAMVIPLGEREAVVPLRALQREFAIADDSEDGQMLALIAESLDYVASLRPGDALPGEVLDGSASWQPEPRHRALVAARLRDQLLFPEIDYMKVDKARGMNVSVVTTARTDEEARKLLQFIGMPFRQ